MIDIGPYYHAMTDPQCFAEKFCKTVHQTDQGPVVDLLPQYAYLMPWWRGFGGHVDIFLEKTRQMVVSWTVAASFLHDILFRRNWSDLMVSRKERLVDDGGSNSTYQSLLGKVRFLWERLPEPLRARLEFSYLKVHNPDTGSTIVGESSGSEAGRGGTFRRVLLDEAAFIPHGESVYAAVRQACPQGLILVSTPHGKGNVFYRIRSQEGAGFRMIRMHWRDHPERRCDCSPSDDPAKHRGCWYANACEDLTPLQIARELNISYEESVGGQVWYGWNDAFVGNVPFIPELAVHRAWDFGVGDQTAILFCQIPILHTATGKAKKQIRIFDAYRNSGQGALHYREVCAEKAKDYGGVPVYDVGDPHNLASRDSALTSWQVNLKDDKHAYKIYVQPSECRGIDYEVVLDNARKFMSLIECQDGEHRPRLLVGRSLRALIQCFEGWHYRCDDEGRIVGEKPIHDPMSHWMDAYKYQAWTADPIESAPDHYHADEMAVLPSGELFPESEMRW